MLPTLIRPAKRLKLSHPHLRISRNYSTESPSVLPTLNDPLQAYISTTRDPYLNLSIEHYLFSKSRPGSKVLFVYTNRPCVVIGRNQNPWIEANLALLKNPQQKSSSSGNVTDEGSQPKLDVTSPIDLVRRRSGGGTVFHDLGNVNWSVTVDADSFTRDKHAQMVVQALRKLGIYRARVNERHDIVLDLGKATEKLDNLRDLHDTPYRDEKGKVHSLKVSGSAFRIAKGRALHHGTALCGSGNLEGMSEVLRAPGRRWFEAKGVESVKSEVGNLDIQNNIFEYAVLKEFMRFYGSAGGTRRLVEPRAVGKEMLEIKEVKKGVEELMVSFRSRFFVGYFLCFNYGWLDRCSRRLIVARMALHPNTSLHIYLSALSQRQSPCSSKLPRPPRHYRESGFGGRSRLYSYP